jgi:DNA repair protein RadC
MRVEEFHVFYLDKIIVSEIHQIGTVDRAVVYPREIIKQVLHHETSSLLLAHTTPVETALPRGQILS